MTLNGSGPMKMVIAIVRHERLQEIQDVLDECGVSGVTVTEVKGCGAQRGYTEKYRGASVHISLRPRLKVDERQRSGFPLRFNPAGWFLGCRRRDFRALLDPRADRTCGAGITHKPVDQLAVPEQAQGRDAHHAVADGDLLVVVDVELAE